MSKPMLPRKGRIIFGIAVVAIGALAVKRFRDHRNRGKNYSDSINRTLDQMGDDIKDLKHTSHKIKDEVKDLVEKVNRK